MGSIVDYNETKDELKYMCQCGNEITKDCSGFESAFIKEFGEYENLQLSCESCNALHIINMNIPIGEFNEIDIETRLMPFAEINARKFLRDLMWAKRTDLKDMDRDLYYSQQKEKVDLKEIQETEIPNTLRDK